MNVICFDLEGPLSPQDNAYEVMRLIANGDKLFEVISRYDDLLSLEGKEDYEPGDTLKLIMPFLMHHGIWRQQIELVSKRARLIRGGKRLISVLRKTGWQVYIISTSYEPHAQNIANQLGVPKSNTYCTRLPSGEGVLTLSRRVGRLLEQVEAKVIGDLYAEDLQRGSKDIAIKEYLDCFFWTEMGLEKFWKHLDLLVVGGRRKAWAVEEIARKRKLSIREIVFVGDSITDVQASRLVESAGGLAIGFNANEYLLRNCTVGVAGTDIRSLGPILGAWKKGGRRGVREMVEGVGAKGGNEGPYYHWIAGKPAEHVTAALAVHLRIRKLVREEAAKLG